MNFLISFRNKFQTIKSMLNLTIIVHDFNKFFFLNPNSIIGQLNKENYIKNLTINNQRKEILNNIINDSPNGEIYKFYKTNLGVEVGITVSHEFKRITTVFRGTDSLLDWFYNLIFFKKTIKSNIKVHYGFYQKIMKEKLFESLKNDLNFLEDKYPDYNLYITGYSLGGGLSTLFGYLYSDFTNKPIEIITFASPRVGNYYFMTEFDNKPNLNLYRIQNNLDIVPVIPFINYYHVGYLVLIKNESLQIFYKYNYDNWTFNCFRYFNSQDHKLERYYDNLNQISVN